MRSRPFLLRIFTFIMLGIVLSMPLQIPFLLDIAWHEVFVIFNHLTWLNILTMVALMTLAFLSYEASRAFFVVAPIAFIVVALNNYWVGSVELNYSYLNANLATLGFLCAHFILLTPKVRAVLIDPKLRWWRTARRKSVQLPVMLYPWVGDTIGAYSCNISSTGVLVKTNSKPNLKVGDQVRMKVNFDGYHDVRCVGELVRYENSQGEDYAAFHFIDIDKKQKRFLGEYVT